MKNSKKKLLINCIALLVAGLFFVLPFWDKPKTAQYDIVFLGDSIIGNNSGSESVPGIVAESLGKSTYNGAFGGTTFSYGDELKWGSVTNAQWSMVKLADAIAYNDWTVQTATMQYADVYSEVNSQALYYFEDRMKGLTEIDFSQVELLVIEHGTNDYNCSRRLDNPEDKYDITTFGGAIRHSLKVLQEAYPQMQIVLMSPIYCELGENREKLCYSWNSGYGTLEQYIELEKQIAQEFGVSYLDAYEESGIGEENAAVYLYDGLHLSKEGIRRLGDFVAEKLKLLLENKS